MTYLAEDDQPSVYILKEDRRQAILTVFNWTDKPRQHEFRFSELGMPATGPLQVLDVFQPGKIISAESGSFKIEQGPHSSRVFKIVDLSMNPAKPGINVRVPQSAVVSEAIRLSATVAQGSVPAISYRWDFGDGTSEDGSEVVHAYTRAGKFVIKIAAEGIDGMSAEQSSELTVSGETNTHFSPEQKRRMP
jgi:alpha-galactosidase